MNILVTGGAGFIGSHLCERLLDDGHRVTCLDDLTSGDQRNVNRLLHRPEYQFVLHDVRLPIPEWMQADQVYHLACPASPVAYQSDPVRTLETNVSGALNVLRYALNREAPVLLASTSEVYGDPEQHPQTEDYVGHVNQLGPRACYDEGKRAAETLFSDYRRMYGLDARIVRIFNTYGPRMRRDDGRVVSNFITQALSGGALTVYGDGSQTRSFCYVDDLVDGLLRAMQAPTLPAPVNLGNPTEVSVRHLAGVISGIAQVELRTATCDLPADDPKRRWPDIQRAAEWLGWAPTTALEDGIRRTFGYFRGQQ